MVIEVKENVSLAPYMIYQIGGPARFFTEAKNRAELEDALQFAAQKKAEVFIMGAGSNTLVSDNGFDGMVIRMTGGEIRIDGERMIADAGVMMARAASEAARAGLAGFAWAIGVPGTIGGSVRGNAGCFGGEIKDVIESVEIFDAGAARGRRLMADECAFGYRDSIFKQHPEWVILSATLRLRYGEATAIQQEIRVMSAERVAKQDIGAKSCGCIFKNPPWPAALQAKEDMLIRFLDLAPYADRAEIPAAFLLDRAGMKGKRAGRIVVSGKHTNFFINEGGGTAEDVISLVMIAKNAVQEKYGIAIEEEIQLLGF